MNREDLAFFFSKYIIDEDYCNKENTEDIKKELVYLLNTIIFNETPLKSKMFFDVLLYINKYEKETTGNFLMEERQRISKIILTLKDVNFLPICLALIALNHKDIGNYICTYMSHHWVVIRDKIIEEKINLWIVAAEFAECNSLIEKLNNLHENFQLKKEGLSLTNIEVATPSNVETQVEESDYAKGWKVKSELRKLGYEVSGKTDRQRQLALLNATRHLSVIQIVIHIEFLLRKSIGIHNLGKRDFSKAINAYEMDLEYLQKMFSSK